MTRPTLPTRLAAAALVACAALPAQAALTVYTSQTTFATAVAGLTSGTDTFTGLPIDFLGSPVARSAGGIGYTVAAPQGLFGAGSTADPWLSTNASGDTLTFSNFATGTRAIGGLFFGSDITGAFLSGQTIVLTAVDSLGARSVATLTNATTSSFAGYLSTGSLVSMTVEISANDGYAAVNNLVLAAVPEPGASALLLAGLMAVGGLVADRRRTQR